MTNQTQDSTQTKTDIETWLAQWIAKEVGMPVETIDSSRSLLEYSLSSVTATILVGDLEDRLGLRLPPTLVWDYPSIDAMTDHLLGQIQEDRSAGVSTPATSSEWAKNDGIAAEASSVDPQKLLANLDHLTDQEVAALLKQLMAEDGVGTQLGTTEV